MDRCRHGRSILVVTGATVGRQALVYALVVTSFAFRHPMGTLQWVSREVVIKLSLIPEILEMTIAAGRQLPIVIILLDMADATLLTATLQGTTNSVTGFAIGQKMHTDELHFLMKIACGFPARFVVTLRAGRAVAAVMRIFVTSRAVFCHEIGKVIFAFKVFIALSIFLFGRHMAFCALHLQMLSFKLKISEIVIKGLLA